MFRSFKNVQIVGASFGVSVRKETIVNRKCHVFFYKAEGQSIYKFGNKELLFSTDKVLYLPEGSSFYYEKAGEIDGQYLSVSFHAEHEGPLGPVLLSLKSSGEVRKLFIKLRQAYRFGGDIGKIEAYSYFYKLLAIFERELIRSEDMSPWDERIEPAVLYLQEHLFDPVLRVSMLHELCKISAPTFRKLFEGRFSVSPKKYVLQQRLQEAADILKSGDCNSVAHVANAVGFDDQLYFSKCFKTFYGVSPSQYVKK